jgi:predicted dehydrogenase
LDSGEVDAVYIPLPNGLHAEWSIEALSRGVSVLCEKPLATTADEVERVATAAAASGASAMEAFMYRFHPQFGLVRRLIEEGAIGSVRTIDAVFTFLLEEPDSIVRSAELAGGALLDVGCYCVDAILRFAADPLEVQAVEHRVDVDEAFFGVMRFGSGVVARLECAVDRDERHRLEISGTSGTIRFDDPWVPGDEEPRVWLERYGQPATPIAVGRADSTRLMIDGFASAWRNRSGPPIPLSDSLATARLIDRLRGAVGAS